MAIEGSKSKMYYEVIAQNVHKGDIFLLRFKDDPTKYEGIPVLDLAASEDDSFTFRIFKPEDKKSTVTRSVNDVEWMEKAG